MPLIVPSGETSILRVVLLPGGGTSILRLARLPVGGASILRVVPFQGDVSIVRLVLPSGVCILRLVLLPFLERKIAKHKQSD